MAAQLPPAAPPRHIAPSAPLRAAQTGPRKTASSADEGWRGRGRGERGLAVRPLAVRLLRRACPRFRQGWLGRRLGDSVTQPAQIDTATRPTPGFGASRKRAEGGATAPALSGSQSQAHSLSASLSQAAAGPCGKGPVSGPSVPPDRPPWPPLAALIRVVGVQPTVSSAPSVSPLPCSASPETRRLTRSRLVCTACLLCASSVPPPLRNLLCVCCASSAAAQARWSRSSGSPLFSFCSAAGVCACSDS